MDKIKIFGIGVSGLVGTRIIEVLKDKYVIDNLSLDTGVNITDPATLDVIRKDTEHQYVLHLAAKADVDACEQEKDLGKESGAYKINVDGTQNVLNAAADGKKKIIYISTDFVFDGENTPEGGYTEEDTPHPINWYSETKFMGEELVKKSGLPYVIARLAFPYRQDGFALKKDFLHAIMSRLEEKKEVKAVTDQMMTPTFLDDFAKGIDGLIENLAEGIYNLTGSQSLSPYDAAILIAEKFNYDKSLISKTTRAEYFKDKAMRPFNLTMNNDKIKKLGVYMRTFEEGLQLVK